MADVVVKDALDKVELITLRYVDTLMRNYSLIRVLNEIDSRIKELEDREEQ